MLFDPYMAGFATDLAYDSVLQGVMLGYRLSVICVQNTAEK